MDDRYKTAKTKLAYLRGFCRDSAISQLELIWSLYMPVHNITSHMIRLPMGPHKCSRRG
jgi:hypothetical protein